MLDAAKIQSGELLLSPAPFDFSAMTSQIILSFEQKIEKKKLEVECELDDRLIVTEIQPLFYPLPLKLSSRFRSCVSPFQLRAKFLSESLPYDKEILFPHIGC